MVLTDNNDVYYLNGDSLCSTVSKKTLDLRSDFTYALSYDNKNANFALDKDSAHLSYDKTSGKVYLIANAAQSWGK